MNFTAFLNWLAANKDGFTALGVIVTILATVIGGLWALRKRRKPAPECVPGSTYTVQGHQFNAGNGGVIKDIHVGDIRQYGLSIDDGMKLVGKLAAAYGNPGIVSQNFTTY